MVSVSISIQLDKQNSYELWDKGFILAIRHYIIMGGTGSHSEMVLEDQRSQLQATLKSLVHLLI